MSWLGRSLGDFGSQAGQGADIAQNWKQRDLEMKLAQVRQKIQEAMLPLQIQDLQQRIKLAGQPQPAGFVNTPGGGTSGVMFDPSNPSKAFSSQSLIPGMDKNAVKAQLGEMVGRATTKEQKAVLESYAGALETGEDPKDVLEKALAFMGRSGEHNDVTNRVKQGNYIPDDDPKSVTHFKREKLDGMGNVVGYTPNVVYPGSMPKVTEGWQVSQLDDGTITMIPKTTVTTPQIPGVGGGARPHASAGGSAGTPGAPGTPNTTPGGTPLPPGSRIIGNKSTEIQRDAVKASAQARDAYVNYQESVKDAAAHNPRSHLALIFHAVRSMVAGAGRMTQVEILKEAEAGSYGDRMKRWATMATEGTLPDDQVQQILGVVKDNYESKRDAGRMAWQFAYPDRELQPWLKGDEKKDSGGAAAAPPPGAEVIDYTHLK
jgi:hypothetical protein